MRPCSNCPAPVPGEKVDESHPNAEYLNDESLWEWKEGPFPGTKIYDLKQEYRDTLIRNNGSRVEVPTWITHLGWNKPQTL